MALAATAVWALAAWVSFGLMALVSDASTARVGVLPDWQLPVAAAIVLLVLACSNRVPDPAWWAALSPSVLLLPWLPLPVPAVFLLWTGPVVWLVWTGTAVAVVAALWKGTPGRRGSVAGGFSVFVLSLAVYAIASLGFATVRPVGDEPHYLVITQSLLLDGDLRIENNHNREDYVAYYHRVLRPDFLRRGVDGQIYSVHAPGLPAIVAPAFAIGGYRGVVAFLVLLAAIGAWLAWRTSLALTGSLGAAWFGWASVSLSVPYLCHAGAAFPDAPGAVLVMTGVWALVRLDALAEADVPSTPDRVPRVESLRWLLHGAALALLPWLHTRFAAAAAVLGTCIALRLVQRRRWAGLAAFGVVPMVSAAGWFSFFHFIYGTFSPNAPYGYWQSSLANLWPGLPALLLDQQYGLLPNAPVYAVALSGLGLMYRGKRRLAVEVTVLVVVYLAAVASYSMWWGGYSAPARFAVPVLLALGPPAAWCWARAGAVGRACATAALAVSLFVAAAFSAVAGGRLMFNDRDGFARWLEWLSPSADLPRALPSFFRASAWTALGDAATWAVVIAVAGLVLRAVGSGRQCRPLRAALAATAPFVFAAAVTVASTLVWAFHGTVAGTPTSGQLRLLSTFDPVSRPVGVSLDPLRLRPPADLVTKLRLATSTRRPLPTASALLALRDVPAGTYRVIRGAAVAHRNLEVGLPGSPGSLGRCEVGVGPAMDCLIHLPINTRELYVAAAPVSSVTIPAPSVELQPIDLLGPRDLPTLLRASVARPYGSLTVFAFDNQVFLETAGAWVAGEADVPVVIAADRARASIAVLLRNGARANRIHLDGAVRLDLALAPHEERMVDIPLDSHSRAAFLRVRTDGGFRPSETDPGSRDGRYLGVWLEMPTD